METHIDIANMIIWRNIYDRVAACYRRLNQVYKIIDPIIRLTKNPDTCNN